MNNFGIIELASARTTSAPGWAYVPDAGGPPAQSVASTAGGNRKRGRAAAAPAALSSADVSARQELKTRRELDVLDRDNARDVSIPVPTTKQQQQQQRSRTAAAKNTPNVRRILQSQKTFANHLDDFEALGREAGGAAAAAAARDTPQGGGSSKRARATSTVAPQPQPQVKAEDEPMPDAAATAAEPHAPTRVPPPPPPHPLDDSPLLASRVPPAPTADELAALLRAPPLTYVEVRALSSSSSAGGGGKAGGGGYPPRAFCAVCGYWGRVRCLKCGARACALDCLETHREECVGRFGL
ncbi:hypothetical protein F4780DRAFT_526486 [Xylariomycetidae sp. FL0641]|nr:hypothetical protein F4780DRAFT_526486 [Xylariomycetidae sp. FL0641]